MRLAAEQAGWQVFRLADWRPPARRFPGEVALYGEPLFVDIMASALDLVVLDSPPDWLAHLPAQYTRRAIAYTTLEEALRLNIPRFVKPALDKCFPAGVSTMSLDAPPACAVLPAETPVLVADPVHWSIEFRCFVLERKLIALSPYLRDGELAHDDAGEWGATEQEWQEAREYCEEVLADLSLDLAPAIVLDVGKIAGAGWAIIETNGAWAAGLYGCDPASVLPVLLRATQKAASLDSSENYWIRPRVEVED